LRSLGDRPMNLEALLDERLWRSIQSFYESRNFTGAILDALYFLSDLIRERTGLESDGTALVGQAFGGKSPKLKVNALQTESEKNIQAGIEQLLRGLFRAIRNPRSHEKYTDNQKDADAIIVFVNYLLGVVDQSKTPFTKSEFLNRVFDPGFVKKTRYAELLEKDIPPKQRLEVMLDVFRKKETGDGEKVKFFVSALLPKLTAQQRKELFAVVSDELITTNSDTTIRYSLEIFPADAVTQLTEAARLRIESKLIESIAEGTYDPESSACRTGALGTWAGNRCMHFLLKDDLIDTLIRKIRSDNPEEHEYLIRFFWDHMSELVNPPSVVLIGALKAKLRAGNKQFYELLSFMEACDESEWLKPFEKELKEFKAVEPTATADDDYKVPF